MSWLNNKSLDFLKSALVKNSAWGLISNILQTLFVSLFFVIVARKFSVNEFAEFLISTTVYQLVAAFSSMGLGQWFIRQYVLETDKLTFTSKFLKTQTGLGLLFYLVNILLAFIIYPDGQIRLLCIILGTNIIFDNFINAIRSLNIAEFRQNKTAAILVIDSILKLLVGCLLFISPFSPVMLSVLMILVRILTVGLFIKLGSSNSIGLKLLWNAHISYVDLKQLILKNWQFIVIGSISIIYWRIGNIIISKTLTLSNVAEYEISCRIFSILSILPVIASATIYPQFIKYFNENNYSGLTKFYNTLFLIYTLFSILSYAFIYSFSPMIIPLAFGSGYPGAVVCLQQMFLTFLIFPTVLLQANLIVAIGLEKMDMMFNIISLLFNLAGCLIGLYFFKSLSVINYSILFSFVIFHILQDILLARKQLTGIKNYILFYIVLVFFVFFYQYIAIHLNPYILFISFSATLFIAFLVIKVFKKSKLNTIDHFGAVLSDK
jgi:O-antigen/teichoic acid export membrane protein